MAKIKIDEKEYDTEDMSDNAKAQLASLQFNDVHINRLRKQREVHNIEHASRLEKMKKVYMKQIFQKFQIYGPI